MTNDETRPLPTDGGARAGAEGTRVDAVNGTHVGSVPAAPPSSWATTQPLAPAPASPYGPPAPTPPGSAEPDPWVDITPGRVEDAPPSGTPGPGQGGQGRRVLGVVGLVAAGAVAGALIVSAVGGLGGSNTATVQPAGASQNGTGPNGVAPGGGVPGGAPGAQGGAQGGVQGGVPGGQGLRGVGGQDGEQRVTGTVTSVSGSRLTVRTSSGTATYQVVPQTQILRNGASASASDLKAGDRVLVHVFPANGSDGVLERVLAVSGSATGSGTAGTQDAEGAEGSDT